MRPAHRERLRGNFQQHDSAETETRTLEVVEFRFPERAALERCRADFMYVRIQLAELKRTGSRKGKNRLESDAVKLSGEIARLENLLTH